MIFNGIGIGGGGGAAGGGDSGDLFTGFLYAPTAPYIGAYQFMSGGPLGNPLGPLLRVASFPNASYIGEGGFKDCANLVSLDIPMLNSIKSSAFEGCVALSLSLPQFTDVSEIPYTAFKSCKRIELPNLAGGFSYSFDCAYNSLSMDLISPFYNAKEVSIPQVSYFNFAAHSNSSTSLWTDYTLIDKFFWEVESLTAGITSKDPFPYSGVGIPAYSFTYLSLSKILSLDMHAFRSFKSLKEVHLSNLISVGNGAFSYCSALSLVDVPNLEIIGPGAFSNCSSLMEIVLPKVASISNNAFYGCSRLLSVNLTNVSSVPKLGSSVFYGTPISTSTYIDGTWIYGSIYVPSSLYNSFKTAQYWSAHSTRMVSV